MREQALEIRRAEPEDFRALKQIHEQPRAVWGTLQLPYPSAQQWRRRLEEQESTHHGLVACAGQQVVGSLFLAVDPAPRRRHVASLGMVVHEAWQRRGIGSALLRAAIDLADRWLGLTRLELTVYADNEPAIRLYEKFGFCVEGRFARYALRDGRYVDALPMARLKWG